MPKLTVPAALAGLTLPLLFVSCATLLNNRNQYIQVVTGKGIRHISIDSCIFMDSGGSNKQINKLYFVRRSRAPLTIRVQTDSGEKKVLLRSHNSAAFWLNLYPAYGLGMLVDWKNPKRYAYPLRTRLEWKDTAIRQYQPPQSWDYQTPIPRGTLRFSLTFAPVNVLNLVSPEGRFVQTGIFGLEAGLDYFYKDARYLSFSGGAGTSQGLGEYLGTGVRKHASMSWLSIRNNYVAGNFDLGYGLSFSDIEWNKSGYKDSVSFYQSDKNAGLGASLSAAYRIGRFLRLGVLYQPTLLGTNFTPSFNYQHYISVNMTWKFPMNRRRGNRAY